MRPAGAVNAPVYTSAGTRSSAIREAWPQGPLTDYSNHTIPVSLSDSFSKPDLSAGLPPATVFADRARPEAKVLILGMGDLGRRIALGLTHRFGPREIVIAGRQAGPGQAFARLLSGCAGAPARVAQADGRDVLQIRDLIERERPDLIVQCASLMSPWELFERGDRLAHALRRAGFALQLCAQLPVIGNLMQAMAISGHACPVVNCSYPDVTHPVLAAQGLAPTIGIGNAGMVLGLARAALAEAASSKLLRVVAHHAHVGAVASADRALLQETPPPRVFLDDEELTELDWLFTGPAIALDRELNTLSAAHALDIIDALLPGGAPLRTSAPGPLGLPGGWPLRIAAGRLELDLPAGVDATAVLADQRRAALADGIADIAPDGVVRFTERLRMCLPDPWRALGEPLHPSDAPQRYALLRRALDARH